MPGERRHVALHAQLTHQLHERTVARVLKGMEGEGEGTQG